MGGVGLKLLSINITPSVPRCASHLFFSFSFFFLFRNVDAVDVARTGVRAPLIGKI